MSVDLALLKKHLRVDYDDDDDLLQHYLDAATKYVVNYIQGDEAEISTEGSLSADVTQVIFLLVAHWYNQREGVSSGSMSQVPNTIDALLKPYRKLTHTTEE